MFPLRGGRGGAARPQVPTSTQPTSAPGRHAVRGRRRQALLLGVVAAVAVLGSACGQYANVHHDRAVAAQQASVTRQKADPSPGPGTHHTVSGSASGDAAVARKADGASGPSTAIQAVGGAVR